MLKLLVSRCAEASFLLFLFFTQPVVAWDAKGLFESSKAINISIELKGTNLTALKDVTQQGNPKIYVRARVQEGTNVFEDVGLRLKGNGSFRSLSDRPSMTLKFDEFKKGQDFHGLTKIHLNNSLTDKSFMTMILCAELFNAAEVPSTRGTYADVSINGDNRGVYILNEGFDKKFLKRYFSNANGNFYEASITQEITEKLRKTSGNEADDKALENLVAAARAPNLDERYKLLNQRLDMERFISMLAMETLTWHWDGYGMHRNNYRVYHNPTTDKIVFCVHGMDQMFWEPKGPLFPPRKGMVAFALMEIPQARERYHQRLTSFYTNVFQLQALTNRMEELHRQLRPVIGKKGPEATEAHNASVQSLRDAIERRVASVGEQLKLGVPPIHFFDHSGQMKLSGWRADGNTNLVVIEIIERGAEADLLHIKALPDNPGAVGSWRLRIELPPGKYTFEGKLKTRGVEALKDSKSAAASLRITRVILGLGRYRYEEEFGKVGSQNENNVGNGAAWQKYQFDFEVKSSAPPETSEVELVCELQAKKGEVWFDLSSLTLKKR